MAQPSGQPKPMEAPPAPDVPWASELMPPDRMQMIEKEIAKFENRRMRRSSSCAYPMPWRVFTSSFLSASVYPCVSAIFKTPLLSPAQLKADKSHTIAQLASRADLPSHQEEHTKSRAPLRGWPI